MRLEKPHGEKPEKKEAEPVGVLTSVWWRVVGYAASWIIASASPGTSTMTPIAETG